jgi:hypothetical protein
VRRAAARAVGRCHPRRAHLPPPPTPQSRQGQGGRGAILPPTPFFSYLRLHVTKITWVPRRQALTHQKIAPHLPSQDLGHLVQRTV